MEYLISLILMTFVFAIIVVFFNSKEPEKLIDYGSVDELLNIKNKKEHKSQYDYTQTEEFKRQEEFFEIQQLRIGFKTLGMSYNTYLQTAPWTKFRFYIYKLRDGECEICEKSLNYKFHVHHINYYRLGHESPNDVSLLCESCHELLHMFHIHNSGSVKKVEFPLVPFTVLKDFEKQNKIIKEKSI